MRWLGVLAGVWLSAWSGYAETVPSIPVAEYQARRQALRKALPDTVIVLFGAKEGPDLHTGFFQDTQFYHLTGWTEPGAALLMTPQEDVLLLPRRDEAAEKWTGRKAAPTDNDVAERSGFRRVAFVETMDAQLLKAVETVPRVAAVLSAPEIAKLKLLLPLREISDCAPELAKLRMRKSPAEVALLRRSLAISEDAHRAAWQAMAPGKYEYEVAAAMTGLYESRGCERSAYAPIVGAGPNAAILHYSANRRRMDAGELLLMDVGAECAMYAADITRTVPVKGEFTPRQRELYEVVLGAQKAVIAATKPGMTLGRTTPDSLYRIAFNYINTHGKDRRGQPLGKYFTHGLGHHLGLDVHDAEIPGEPLAPGMVITIEPGVYLPEEGIGIRIEDVVLVTEKGCEVLTHNLPKEAAELERAIRAGK